jgi:hypothetical protein
VDGKDKKVILSHFLTYAGFIVAFFVWIQLSRATSRLWRVVGAVALFGLSMVVLRVVG